jgi:hypothetical protein
MTRARAALAPGKLGLDERTAGRLGLGSGRLHVAREYSVNGCRVVAVAWRPVIDMTLDEVPAAHSGRSCGYRLMVA